jgi:hypothetical protein
LTHKYSGLNPIEDATNLIIIAFNACRIPSASSVCFQVGPQYSVVVFAIHILISAFGQDGGAWFRGTLIGPLAAYE